MCGNRRQIPIRRCYVSTSLQLLDQGDKQHHYYHLENLSDLFLYYTQQVLEILAKIWLIWDCKFRYLIVVCVSSLIVKMSENESGVTVCLWLRSELLTAVTCLPCWDVTPCSLVDMCQDCNWAQRNQTWFLIHYD